MIPFALLVMYGLYAQAADISLNVNVTTKNDVITIQVKNIGVDPALGLFVHTELAGKHYEKYLTKELVHGSVIAAKLLVDFPEKRGTYPLVTTIYYYNDGKRLSLLNVGAFYYKEHGKLQESVQLPDVLLGMRKVLSLKYDTGKHLRLAVPDEIHITSEQERPFSKTFTLENTRLEFSTSYTIYAILEDDTGPVHRTSITQGRLTTRKLVKRSSLFSPFFLGIAACLGYLFARFLFQGWRTEDDFHFSRFQVSLIRWSFSVFVISSAFFLFHTLHIIPDFIATNIAPDHHPSSAIGVEVWRIFRILTNWFYFEGKGYDYFTAVVANPLYIYMLSLNGLVIYYLIRPDPRNDKIWHLMLTTFSLPGLLSGRSVHWTPQSRLGLLTLGVKVFFVPLLSSWAINNILHQNNLIQGFQWDFFYINRFLVDLFILIDVCIFAVGYLIELPKLNNQIKSVEPTLLGWTVCLMCYPPFNTFSFSYVDVPLSDHWAPPGSIAMMFATIGITVLWAVYTWATVALGWKASNLTNRGIVHKGPYRYIRHPAYVSKIILWTVSAYFLGEKNFFLIVSLVIVYALRAWTEERHLSSDPEYLDYKKRVKYVFVPYLV